MIIALPQQDYVQASGPDASEFLQGQVTCDMQSLKPSRSLRGALCNLKGRVIANFRALAVANDIILLQTTPGMGQHILSTLAKYAVFSKVELELLQAPPANFGFYAPQAAESVLPALTALTDQPLPLALDDCISTDWGLLLQVGRLQPRFQLIQTAEAFSKPPARLPEQLLSEQTDLAHWHCADIRDGEVHISEALSGEYTPQLLNYDISGSVNFKKGCYTGQEVVARMHYRGKPKQRMFLLRGTKPFIFGDTALIPKDNSEQRAQILTTATNPNTSESIALAVLPVSLLENTDKPVQLTLKSQQDTVQAEHLLYGI